KTNRTFCAPNVSGQHRRQKPVVAGAGIPGFSRTTAPPKDRPVLAHYLSTEFGDTVRTGIESGMPQSPIRPQTFDTSFVYGFALGQADIYNRYPVQLVSHINEEPALRDLYRGRQILELLQNADDAGHGYAGTTKR